MGITKDFIWSLRKQGIKIWIDGEKIHYQAEKGVVTPEIISKIKDRKQDILDYLNQEEEILVFEEDFEHRYEPFALTNIQNSYVIGRNKMYSLGDVTCHGYIEITYNEKIEHKKLVEAWNKVIAKHDMLRAIIYSDGYQQVQKNVPKLDIKFFDFTNYTEEESQAELLKIRKLYGEKEYDLGVWPMCDIVLSRTCNKSTIHFSLDMLITDFMSANLILDDLDNYYHNRAVDEEVGVLYRDIVLYNKKLETKKTTKRIIDEEYWKNKIEKMGGASELLTDIKDTTGMPKFEQAKFFIDAKGKEGVNQFAKNLGVTPSLLILTAFGEVINKWSKNSKFSINLTLLNRNKEIKNVEKVVGDFTDVNVFSMDFSAEKSFKERILQYQIELLEDLQHKSVSGIEVLRDLGRKHKENLIIPIVYTSTLGTSNVADSFLSRSEITYKISQTPQVWIDCQVAEENGGISVNWDYRTGIFSDETLNAMFEAFRNLLVKISNEEYSLLEMRDPIGLPQATRLIRDKVNHTKKEFDDGLLCDGFLKNCKLYPNKTALITKDGEYTYAVLEEYVAKVQNYLGDMGFQNGEKVAVMLQKNVWQIAGVLGALLAGGVYLPIDPTLPIQRRNNIIKDSGVKYLLVDREEALENKEELKIITTNFLESLPSKPINVMYKAQSTNPAYIIYTSGTTGVPKGVVISHRAAMNTIYDIIERFEYSKNDIFLGLSNLAFDLSVFDIFGAFTLGATLVIPDDELKKNPKYLLGLLIIHKITAWNSVPAQMQMITSYMEGLDSNFDLNLRVILLSGDWILVNLPEKIFNAAPNAMVVSLGGATEAAIWSIFHRIEKNYKKTNSIPYGTPLSNQRFYILNESLGDCPDGVEGEIYIAGEGLALEYFKDKELSAEKFIFLQRINERIYKTGDLGKYDENGVIEFIGRIDNQVKVRGHRVELSEIDSILSLNNDVQNVASIILGENPADKRIATVVVPKHRKNQNYEKSIQELNTLKSKEIELTKDINEDLLPEWIKAANEVVLSDIFSTFNQKDIFTQPQKIHTFKDIVKALNIADKLHKLMKRWLKVLNDENIILSCDEGYKVNISVAEKYIDNKSLWDRMYAIESKLNYSKKLLDYLKTSGELLPQLMRGEEDPLNLLFPKGDVEVAMAAYHDNMINSIMNALVKEEVRFLVSNKSENPIKILEVGAGVGGTSVDVIPMLDSMGAEYYFTDLSTFFLNNAKEKFENYDWIKYEVFDINKDIMEQKIEPFSLDVILAANVLHNAKNIHNVMENLKKLLKPNGTIIILEETQEAYTLLTSMEFKDGLTDFTDERLQNNQTFFKREQWENIFKEHKANIAYEFPRKNTPLEMAGQTIYVIRFEENYICLDKKEIFKELKAKLPEYMLPSILSFLPQLPQTSNGKIDRNKIALWLEENLGNNEKNEKIDLPKSILEEEIARIWRKELNLEQIGRNDNFYLIGGDSLVITKVISRMKEEIKEAADWSWDDLLKEMMKVPTVKGLASVLLEQNKGELQDKSLVVVKEARSTPAKVVVVFHAGTGTLTPYNSLITYITQKSGKNEAVIGFTFGDEASYLAMQTEKIFEILGNKYGEMLEKMDFSEYVLMGHCVGGLIALEAAHYLESHNKKVSSVTLLSTSIPYKKEQIWLHTLDVEIFQNAVHTSLYNELLLERTFASLIGADIKKAGHKVDNDTLQKILEHLIFKNNGNITVENICKLDGEFLEVGREFTRLSNMSATERMNDLYATIERPNGELMEHQRKMLNVLFRVFAQNFRCVSSYLPKKYAGRLRVFNCEDEIANFFPSFFSEDKQTWENFSTGELYFDTMKGDHISCMNSPYIEENVEKILNF